MARGDGLWSGADRAAGAGHGGGGRRLRRVAVSGAVKAAAVGDLHQRRGHRGARNVAAVVGLERTVVERAAAVQSVFVDAVWAVQLPEQRRAIFEFDLAGGAGVLVGVESAAAEEAGGR